jgi:transcription-repair coupling factor (superfamily II helicase)
MAFSHLSDFWSTAQLAGVSGWSTAKPTVSLFSGCAGSSDAFLIAELYRSSDASVLVSVENSKRAEVLFEECASLVGEEAVSLFSSRDAVPYNMKSPFGPVVENRFKVLSKLLSGVRGIYIAPHPSMLQKVPPPRDLFNRIIRISTGQDLSIETLSAWLVDNNFRRETMVQDVGSFGIRGGIVDIYPFMTEGPVRIEFFGDTIESIREFDVFSQKSSGSRQSVEIFPMKEYCLDASAVERGLAALSANVEKFPEGAAGFQMLSHQWRNLSDHDGIEWFLHYFSIPEVSIFEYLPHGTVVVWDDLLPPDRRFDECVQNYERHLERVPDIFVPLVSPPQSLLVEKQDALAGLALFPRVYIGTAGAESAQYSCDCDTIEQPAFPQAIEPLIAHFSQYHEQGFDLAVVCGNEGYAQRLLELIGEACPFVKAFIGYLHRGFIDRANRRLVFADTQLFDRPPSRQIVHKKIKAGQAISSYDSLSPGDFVVHIDHGIGRFVGIERIEAADMSRDCMVILYQSNAKLCVPVDDFHKVQKYIGKESAAPLLSKLGSGAWERVKAKTRESLREMVQELIELYSKRQYFEGIAFSKDTLWQKEFEESFIFEETPDQLRAIAEVKKDMESKKPMDRLICGDVGFGKTEVAMRAAFKAVMDGYQVALLAPTTILTAQHYATLTQRMADFPVRIAMLSRFLTSREQKDVVGRVKDGAVDILIGTHRILSQDIVFKNLGLLVIDEEQRFGVRHKEKLKQYRYKVDVLSMTATPIPRTLHLSLVGARDLSIINTPPRNRLPIETHVAEYHDEILRQAIENELDRGGQVYVVNNRIQTLDAIKDRIEQMVPRARVVCAHGQMDEGEQLERIMKEFVAGRFDALVSTVIIENGLDIPNVNTIVVNRADTMGLSQLYQLRGRVGRSSEQAFAYFLTPPFREVTELALKRLRVLEQYTDLGSGFQIAMRDLEIRGAGNILGDHQHGFIAAVGFELYCRLLEDAVKELRGEKKPSAEKQPETAVDIQLPAFIPTEYVADGGARIAVYQELSGAMTIGDVEGVRQALHDRFGPMPPSVCALLLLMRIKVMARSIGCVKVSIAQKGSMQLFFEGDNKEIRDKIERIFSKTDRHFDVVSGPPFMLTTVLNAKTIEEQTHEAGAILQSIA